jgi:hypothetical protein
MRRGRVEKTNDTAYDMRELGKRRAGMLSLHTRCNTKPRGQMLHHWWRWQCWRRWQLWRPRKRAQPQSGHRSAAAPCSE